MAELRDLVGGFLVTFVEREGRLKGGDLERARRSGWNWPAVISDRSERRLRSSGTRGQDRRSRRDGNWRGREPLAAGARQRRASGSKAGVPH